MRGGWHERFNDGWGAQHIIGMVLMALFVASVIWLIVSFVRKNANGAASAASAVAVSPTKSAEQILAALVVLFFIVTIVRLGGHVADRPM